MQRTAYLGRIGSLAVMLGVGIAIAIGVGFGTASADTGASSPGASSVAGPRASAHGTANSKRKAPKVTVVQANIAAKPVPKAISPRIKPAAAQPTAVQQISGLIQTAIGTVFNNFLRITQGPPRLPPGSTVTLHSASLQLPCDNANCKVSADWYFPADPNPKGVIYLQHGSLTNGSMYSYTAANLAESTDSIVVVPTITDFYEAHGYWLGGPAMQQAVAELFSGDREALIASASTAAGHPVTLPEPVAFIGHSAGGDLVTGTAADMVANGWGDVAGVVLLDGYTADPRQFTVNVTTIPTTIPVLMIAAPPSYYNQLGAASRALVSARPGVFAGLQLKGGTHVDGMQGGNPLTQLAESLVAGFPKPQNTAAVRQLSAEWINDMFDGDTIAGTPGQTVQIPTAHGMATGYTLPAPATTPSPIDVLLVAFTNFITNLLT